MISEIASWICIVESLYQFFYFLQYFLFILYFTILIWYYLKYLYDKYKHLSAQFKKTFKSSDGTIADSWSDSNQMNAICLSVIHTQHAKLTICLSVIPFEIALFVNDNIHLLIGYEHLCLCIICLYSMLHYRYSHRSQATLSCPIIGLIMARNFNDGNTQTQPQTQEQQTQPQTQQNNNAWDPFASNDAPVQTQPQTQHQTQPQTQQTNDTMGWDSLVSDIYFILFCLWKAPPSTGNRRHPPLLGVKCVLVLIAKPLLWR